MHERLAEKISAFADGDPGATGDPALAEALMHDRAAQAVWARYHLIGDALRQGLPPRLDRRLPQMVGERLAAEPVLVLMRPRRPRPAVRPLAALAMAASVAAIAVLAVNRWYGPEPLGAPASLAGSTPVSEPAHTPVAEARVHWTPADDTASSRLNSYLIHYSEQRSTMALPGMLPPYVRLVGHEGD